MSEIKGLTGITEKIRGYVGGKTIVRRRAVSSGRSTIFFDLYCGIEKNGAFPTIRHCIVYGQAADNLKDITKGFYVEVAGFIQTVGLRNKAGVLIMSDGVVLREERLISEDAHIIPKDIHRTGRQLPFGGESLALVGQTS